MELDRIECEIHSGHFYCFRIWKRNGKVVNCNVSATCRADDPIIAVIAQEAWRQSVLLKVPLVMGANLSEFLPKYVDAFESAMCYIDMEDGYLSSLKQGATDMGIPYGDEMELFVKWAEKRMGL